MVKSAQGLNETYGSAVKYLLRVTKLWAEGDGRGGLRSALFPALCSFTADRGGMGRASGAGFSAASEPQAGPLTLSAFTLPGCKNEDPSVFRRWL